METLELVLAWIIPLLVLTLLYRSHGEVLRINGIYRRLAEENGGSVSRRSWFDYPVLTVSDHGSIFDMGTSLASGGDVWVTRLALPHQQAWGFELHIQPHSRLEKFASAIGFQDADIGSPAFGRHFLAKTDSLAKARAFLNEELQQVLIHLHRLNPELTIVRHSIILTCSFTDSPNDLQELVDFGRLLCSRTDEFQPPAL